MDSVQKTLPEAGANQQENEVTLIDLFIIFAKHKKWIVGLPLVAALIAAGISMLLPNVYKATARLLPPQQSQSGASALLSQLGGVAAAAGVGSGMKNPNDLYVGMLKSRTVADRIIAQYGLKKIYHTDSQDAAREALDASSTIAAGKEGLITIEVASKDKQLVAKLANSYVDELMRLTRSLAVTEASQRRLFFQQQLEQAKDNLSKAEMSLKGSLDAHGVISVDNESAAMVATVAKLKAEISAKEIELNSMKAFVTANHPQYQRAEQDLSSLRQELSNLENGNPADQTPKAASENGFRNIASLRDVKYYQMLYELLAKQYEAARLEEAKDPSVIQVLDPAVEPERKFKPKRSVIVLVSALLTFVGTCLGALVYEANRRALQTPRGAARWRDLKYYLGLK